MQGTIGQSPPIAFPACAKYTLSELAVKGKANRNHVLDVSDIVKLLQGETNPMHRLLNLYEQEGILRSRKDKGRETSRQRKGSELQCDNSMIYRSKLIGAIYKRKFGILQNKPVPIRLSTPTTLSMPIKKGTINQIRTISALYDFLAYKRHVK